MVMIPHISDLCEITLCHTMIVTYRRVCFFSGNASVPDVHKRLYKVIYNTCTPEVPVAIRNGFESLDFLYYNVGSVRRMRTRIRRNGRAQNELPHDAGLTRGRRSRGKLRVVQTSC